MVWKAMKRIFDFCSAAILFVALLLPIMVIALMIKWTSPGPIVYWSRRIGRDNRIFFMPKFRTMRIDAPEVATHLLENSEEYVTPIGSFLRKYSLDEITQIWSVIVGDMSFVGPRPALYNQHDLIELRTNAGVHRIIPGITGWAQINGRDDISIPMKVQYDIYYMNHRSFLFDLKILFNTFFKVVKAEGVNY
jgi:O-antigen biosynthesis protein WbqP